MIRTLYEAAAAMMAQFARQLALSNDLSNAQTPGYRREIGRVNDFQEMLLSRIGGGQAQLVGPVSTAVRYDQPTVDERQGALVETGRPLDLAITGRAFFTIQTPQGVQYTRDGRFQLNAQRQLVTTDGMPVLGVNGPITIPAGDVAVDPDGTVRVNGQTVGQLLLTDLPANATLTPVGQNRFTANAAGQPAQGSGVSQGFLEQSNVDITQTLTEMLAASRSYALAQRALQLADDSLRLAVNDVGRVSA